MIGAQVTFTAPGSGPTAALVGPAIVTTDDEGIATSSTLTANGETGPFQVTVTVAGATVPAVFGLTNVSGAANRLTFVQQPTDAIAGATIAPPVTVQLVDSFGNPVHTADVAVALQEGLVSVAHPQGLRVFAPQNTDANGLATFSGLSISQVGQYQLEAAANAIASATSQTFRITAGTPAAIRIEGGTPQSTAILTSFAQPLEVSVLDAFGNAVSGVAVSFAGPGSGASAVLSPASATTNNAGRVSIPRRRTRS